ncbi:MAG: rhodanese-like domain-containing protein [Gammaproteobacteria bacterium]
MDRLVEYIGHHPYLAGLALLAAVMVIGYELNARKHSFAAISPQDAIRLMNQNALVLDLRPAEAFASGHLNGARNFAPDQILKAGDTLKKYKEKPVVVYDESGSLGTSAARQLAAQGFTKAVNLRGGIAAWRTENLPVAKD